MTPLAMPTSRRRRRQEAIALHARLLPSGSPVPCFPSVLELTGVERRKQSAKSDGKIIYDSREAAEACARLLEQTGAGPFSTYQCRRGSRGHWHLTTDKRSPKAVL